MSSLNSVSRDANTKLSAKWTERNSMCYVGDSGNGAEMA
jgi:hypothetical protein